MIMIVVTRIQLAYTNNTNHKWFRHDEAHDEGETDNDDNDVNDNDDNEHPYTNQQIYKCFGHDELHD